MRSRNTKAHPLGAAVQELEKRKLRTKARDRRAQKIAPQNIKEVYQNEGEEIVLEMQGEFDPKRKTLEVARDIPQREKDLAVIDKMLEGSAIKL